MSVITISSQFGAGGPAVGVTLAEQLGWEYVDKQIIHRIALDLKIPVAEVAEFDEARHQGLRGFLSTVFDFRALRKGVEVEGEGTGSYDDRDEVPYDYRVQGWIDKDIYQQMMVRVITAIGERGGAVIKGRGSQWILRDAPGAIHVRFVSEEADRVARTMQRRGLKEAAARKLVEQMDQRGVEFVKDYFGRDLTDPTLYTLVLNTSKLSLEECGEILAGLVKRQGAG
ncbi:MAG: cytidylate kinase-like family protein [Deferrisomatales bacterium]|nr:cytidylate kinase-like family protein [Deferrisomatales bacterium]